MRLTLLGSGDAFGSGGRFNTSFFVDRGQDSVLIDCGASTMIAIRKFGIDPELDKHCPFLRSEVNQTIGFAGT